MSHGAIVAATLAQSAEGETSTLPVVLFYLGIPAFSIVAVGVACWVFWRAKQRDEERERNESRAQTPSNKKDLTWRNARSS